jgi:signal transduction histidine kinase
MAEVAPTNQAPKFRRRKILVQPGYQLRVAATVLLCIIGYSLLLGFLIFYPLQQEFDAAINSEPHFWIARQVLDLHMRFWPSILVVAVLVSIQSIYVTHRIVGPAYHIRRVLTDLGGGQLTRRVRLRRWDRLKEIEQAANGLAEGLEREAKGRAALREEARSALAEMRAAVESAGSPGAVRGALERLERLLGA